MLIAANMLTVKKPGSLSLAELPAPAWGTGEVSTHTPTSPSSSFGDAENLPIIFRSRKRSAARG